MAKKGKKEKVKKGSLQFDESALDQLTSRIEQDLSVKKRKQPPTAAKREASKPKKARTSGAPGPEVDGRVNDAALLEEIKALGGDESDLALIHGIDSEDEVFNKNPEKKPADEKLKKELLAFTKELGFADHAPAEASEGEGEDEPEEEEEEESSDVEGVGGDNSDRESAESEEDENELRELKGKEKAKAGNLTFEPRADWHAAKLPKLPAPQSEQLGQFSGVMESLKNYGISLLEQDATRYRTSIFAQASHKFLATIMSTGTLSDKTSALTLAVQESPVHNIRAFDALMNQASKKSRAQAIAGLGALVDLLGPGSALPADRRLRPFQSQPGLLGTLQRTDTKSWNIGQPLPGKISKVHLMVWAYEDWLKDTFFKIVQLLEVWCSDEIEYSRMKAIDLVYGLLKEKPEQEANLLRLLVNKLGDRDRKISSRTSYLLLQLQNSHPGMKAVIVHTIEQHILLHPGQDPRTRYSAINTLNQTILSNKEPAVAEHLVRIYFDLFVTLLRTGNLGVEARAESDSAFTNGKKDEKPGEKPKGKAKKPSRTPRISEKETEAADKLVSALLTGVNRAAPFVSAEEAIMENNIDTLFRIAHSANFNTGIQALLLIQHLSQSRQMASDRFYRTLYESLLDPRLVSSSKQALYLNLLLRALKNDVDVRRVKAFTKRMMQISSLHNPPFVCGLLYIVSQLRETFPDLNTLVEEAEEAAADDGDPSEPRPVYDGRKRDPEHSNASRSCLWEIVPTLAHFHPSVHVIASTLLTRGRKAEKPDMDSHSLIRFLDKFVYRKPKTTDTSRGVSIMQPLRAAQDVGDIWLGGGASTKSASTVNSAAFWNKKVEEVAAEDVFFHEYFQHTSRESESRSKSSKANGGRKEDKEEEEAQEDEIWKALVSSHPEVDGDIDDGSDVGFDDLDEDEMASDGDESPGLDLDDSEEDASDGSGDDSDGLPAMDAGDDSDGLLPATDVESGKLELEPKKQSSTKARRDRKRELKALPMFASVDDYAEMLAGEESS